MGDEAFQTKKKSIMYCNSGPNFPRSPADVTSDDAECAIWRWMRHALLWSPGDCLEVWINNKTAVIAGVCVREGYSPRTHYYEAPVTGSADE